MTARHRIATALVLTLALAAVSTTAPSHAAPAAAADTKPVDINTAASVDLEAVPGIGKSLAARIVAFREKNGAFKSVDELLKVQGIGEKSLEKLRPFLTAGRAK